MRNPKMMSREEIKMKADRAEIKSIQGKLRNGATIASLGLNERQLKLWSEYMMDESQRKNKGSESCDMTMSTGVLTGEAKEISIQPKTRNYSVQEIKSFFKSTLPTEARAGTRNNNVFGKLNFDERNSTLKNPKFYDLEIDTTDLKIVHKFGILCDDKGNMTDEQVESNKDKFWTMDEIMPFLEKQMTLNNGKIIASDHDLLVTENFHSNIFFVMGPYNKVYLFRTYWDPIDKYWDMDYYNLGYNSEAGDRVFLRN